MPAVQVSDEDRAFLLALRERQRVAATQAAVSSPSDTDDADDRRRAWDFDGSIVVGRIDDADGRRRYLGTRAVTIGDELLVHDVVAPDIAPLWAATREDPAGLVLKRRLRVEGWQVVAWHSEFDLRTPSSAVAGTRAVDADPASKPAAVRKLHSDRDDILALLDSCRAAASDGMRVPDDAPMALRRWNDSLDRVARLVTAVGAPPVPPRLEAIEKALRDAEQFETVERARRLLRDRLAGIESLLVATGVRPDSPPRPGDEVLRETRDRLQAELDALG